MCVRARACMFIWVKMLYTVDAQINETDILLITFSIQIENDFIYVDLQYVFASQNSRSAG